MGEAPIELRATYLSTEEADHLMSHLVGATPWRTSSLTMYGRTIAMPRLIAWYADAPYTFLSLIHILRAHETSLRIAFAVFCL